MFTHIKANINIFAFIDITYLLTTTLILWLNNHNFLLMEYNVYD